MKILSAIETILKLHQDWLDNKEHGERANLTKANLSGANLFGANLSGANLSGADLSGAVLSGAVLLKTIYEKDTPIIINTEFYSIVKTKEYIKIGCKQYTPAQWSKFTKAEIQAMDVVNALKFWKKYKKLVLLKV